MHTAANLARYMWCLLSIILGSITLAFGEEPAATPAPTLTTPQRPTFYLGFQGGGTSGKINAAASPKEANYAASMVDATGYFVGVSLETAIASQIKLFIDGNTAMQKTPVASSGGYANSFWVYEMSGYTSHDVGPFSTDVNAVIQGTGFRLGAKYFISDSGMFQPWIGLGYGIYTWSFDYLNSERTKSYGKATGTVTGLTYLLGVNLEVDDKTNIVLFGDLASPVASPKIDNLFNAGWTWENPGLNHIFGPYRVGIAIQFGT
jgi:hypothetical protein